MTATGVGTTNPDLLRRVGALWDDPAWREFFSRYAPFVGARCSVYGLDSAAVDELCQRVWVELARRMPSFQYDPGRSFRGWLRRLCHHRAIDLLRERRDHGLEVLDDEELIDGRWLDEDNDADPEAVDVASGRLRLLREALLVQEEVRRRVKPARWEAFWRVVIEGQSVGEAAAAFGMKYATVYAGVNHVAELLRSEGRRRKARLGLDESLHPAKG
jgi:RNA polymerase sigma factor (sigma-70 family)